jgi:hypothetical protein
MGLMAGFLFSLKQVHPTIEFRFGWGTVAAFLITAAVSWKFCDVIARPDNNAQPGERRFVVRWMVGFIGLSSLGTIAAFAYSLRNVSSASRWEVIEGTGIALAVLSVGAWLIVKVFKFFEEQSAAELEQQRRDHEAADEEENEQK